MVGNELTSAGSISSELNISKKMKTANRKDFTDSKHICLDCLGVVISNKLKVFPALSEIPICFFSSNICLGKVANTQLHSSEV